MLGASLCPYPIFLQGPPLQDARRTPTLKAFVQYPTFKAKYEGYFPSLHSNRPKPAAAIATKPEAISRLAAPLSEEPVSELLSPDSVAEAKPV